MKKILITTLVVLISIVSLTIVSRLNKTNSAKLITTATAIPSFDSEKTFICYQKNDKFKIFDDSFTADYKKVACDNESNITRIVLSLQYQKLPTEHKIIQTQINKWFIDRGWISKGNDEYQYNFLLNDIKAHVWFWHSDSNNITITLDKN